MGIRSRLAWIGAAVFVFTSTVARAAGPAVLVPRGASALERLAASEVARYLYVRTGRLLPIQQGDRLGHASGIIVSRARRPLAQDAARAAGAGALAAALKPQGYLLRAFAAPGGRCVLVTGGDDAGTLYGAYRFAEHMGVRFDLSGDTIPDGLIPLRLPDVNEVRAPLFALRGIQPFHDFPEGPDWWNLDDYRAYIGQLPKLGMNFIGLHTYPEPIAEPTVWIGIPQDAGPATSVAFAYPSSYQNTLRGDWGYAARPTSGFHFGASELFTRDGYGSDVMAGFEPKPAAPDACVQLFNRTGEMLGRAFTFAHTLGVRTCLGTETPLTIPQALQARLKAMGRDPADPAVVQEVYEGIFRRLGAANPLGYYTPVDYYWFWTPEGWTWSGTTDAQVQATLADLRAAQKAAEAVGAPFRLATCGWVLGPPQDRSLFDKALPKSWPVSCINRQVGNEPVEPAFAQVKGRPKWAIPWMEDDPGLTMPQLWAGRMRRDAFDARQYGCDGLMGIHWRTRVLSPNVAALAEAAWDQKGWATGAPATGPVGGNVAVFADAPIAGTPDPELYRTVRYGMASYHIAAPPGRYAVTLRFCEPAYSSAGTRVFGVKLQGRTVIDRLDVFERVGKNRALDFTFRDVDVAGRGLDIDFTPIIEFPCIAAIAVEGPGAAVRINCGGPAYKTYSADPPGPARGLPVTDFYRDWATAQFGPAVGPRAARVFARIDGNLPRPATWTDGPGGLTPDGRPWAQVASEFAFVDAFGALRSAVRGPASMARFDYWLNTFRYLRAMAAVRCAWGAFDRAMAGVRAEKDPDARAAAARRDGLPARMALVRAVREAYSYLLPTVTSPGEMGTIANWEQHILPGLLERPGRELAGALGSSLPSSAEPDRLYHGPTRVVVPTVRTAVSAEEGLPLVVTAMVLSGRPASDVALCWRPMGQARYARVPLRRVARGVYRGDVPVSAARGLGYEYYVRAVAADGQAVCFPATAPARGQTVVVTK